MNQTIQEADGAYILDPCPNMIALTNPTFDKDGYPTDETGWTITHWPSGDPNGWIGFIRRAWHHGYGRIWEEDGFLKLATGGWSGNESIIQAMQRNYVLWSLLWESSHRGGLEVLRVPYAHTKP